MPRGRKPGQVVKRKESQKGYVIINKKLRLKVETDCLTLEELLGNNKETGEGTYGNYKYFTSWSSVLDYLIKKFTAEKVSKQGILTFQEARQEILNGIKEVKQILLGEIEQQRKIADEEIKNAINKFNR
jgi:hypothetical protein